MRSLALSSVAAAVLVLGMAGRAACNDPWEVAVTLGGINGDDDFNTLNILRHGVVQEGHDLEGLPANPDQDWMRVVGKEGHSYVARVSGLYWNDTCPPATCPRFDRVDSAGVILTPGVASSEDAVQGPYSIGRTVRWIAAPGGPASFLRAVGDQLFDVPAAPYAVEFYDTTAFVPRWNNSATQATVFIMQNTSNTLVQGFVYFYNGAGSLLASQPLSVPEHGVQVLNTASIPGLAGLSGSAAIAQLGGYGAITGKAVALEPATGFTFDTPITLVPR